MSKQHCRALQVERFFRQSRTLLRQCCLLLRHCCWCGRGLRLRYRTSLRVYCCLPVRKDITARQSLSEMCTTGRPNKLSVDSQSVNTSYTAEYITRNMNSPGQHWHSVDVVRCNVSIAALTDVVPQWSVSRHSSDSSLSSAFTPCVFHSRLTVYLLRKSFHPSNHGLFSSSRTTFADRVLAPDQFVRWPRLAVSVM